MSNVVLTACVYRYKGKMSHYGLTMNGGNVYVCMHGEGGCMHVSVTDIVFVGLCPYCSRNKNSPK